MASNVNFTRVTTYFGLPFSPFPYDYFDAQIFRERELSDNAHPQAWDSNEMMSQRKDSLAPGYTVPSYQGGYL